ncbi:MAG: FAD-dependent oxidoreductase [Eubacteriales bacterium]|nr:FAD-dependent oxidoreductase [Eubacteriales bacterium]
MANRYDVIIVGGGPAGLTAAIYVGRAGKSAAVFEKEMIGGQITYTGEIDNFPAVPGIGGAEYAMKLQEQAESCGAEIYMEEIQEIQKEADGTFTLRTEDDSYGAEAVILATGLQRRKMEVPGEETLTGRGLSYCAVCDGAFFRNRDVAVYGGGNTAVEDAIYLAGICRKVTIIHRRNRFRAEERLVQELKSKDNVEFALEKTVASVEGEKMVTGVTVLDGNTGETTLIPVDGMFVAIGQIPNGDAFRNLVETDEAGYYQVDENCTATTEGVFVAGDGREKSVRQLTTAVGDGAVAATNACRYVDRLHGNEYI